MEWRRTLAAASAGNGRAGNDGAGGVRHGSADVTGVSDLREASGRCREHREKQE